MSRQLRVAIPRNGWWRSRRRPKALLSVGALLSLAGCRCAETPRDDPGGRPAALHTVASAPTRTDAGPRSSIPPSKAEAPRADQPVLTRAVPGIGFADDQGRYWRPVVRGQRVLLERAREHEQLLAIVPGAPFKYWLYKSGQVAAVGTVWDYEGGLELDWREPHPVPGATDALDVSGAPNGCLLRAGGKLDCFTQVVRTDKYGVAIGVDRSPFVTVAESGVEKLVGGGGTCFLKNGRVRCVHVRWTPDMAQPVVSQRVVPGIEGADDLCVPHTTTTNYPMGCARVAGEVKCWDVEGDAPRTPEPNGSFPVRFTEPADLKPGLKVSQLYCNIGATGVLDERGTLWMQRSWEASPALHRAEAFGRLRAVRAQSGLLCGVSVSRSLLCCGDVAGYVRVGSGKRGPDCVPERIFAEKTE